MSKVLCQNDGCMGYVIEIDLAGGRIIFPWQAPVRTRGRRCGKGVSTRAARRSEFHRWRASLPTPLERDTLLMPEVIADMVVAEAERFLPAELPAGHAGRLAARAQHLYAVNRHFKKTMNGPGNQGRDMLYVYMRHWTAGWLKRERNPLFQRLPAEYAMGRPLPGS